MAPLPPDLSLIVNAREGGPNYVYGILTGFVQAPAGFKMQDGMNYNTMFPGHQIDMPPAVAGRHRRIHRRHPATP